MKKTLLFLFLAGTGIIAQAQPDSISACIFIPHPRSDDKVNQSVLPGIEMINFSNFEMILLGGDLTYYTSINRISMDYCDSLFNLGNPNTLWTMGNHDLASRSLVEEYTGRPSFYSYTISNITFLVLDTELDAASFSSSHISGDQLAMIGQVCDTIANSDYLVLLHHRLLWMVGNDYFIPLMDSVAQSTRQLDTSNFNTVVYPLLQQAKGRGVRVICLGGDRSMVNIEYSPEDSITFIASTMAPEFTDAQNDVVMLHYNRQTGILSTEFVPLDQVEKNPPVTGIMNRDQSPNAHLYAAYNHASGAIHAGFHTDLNQQGWLQIYSLYGQLVFLEMIKPEETKTIPVRGKGLYIVAVNINGLIESQKISVYE